MPGDPTTQWIAIPYPTNIVSDFITDQQTGTEESDIVGTNGLPALYTRYFGATTPTNGTIGFRVRLGKDASPAGFKAVFHVGIVPTNGNAMKLLVSVDNSGAASNIRMFNPGASANTSPSTTSIDAANPLFTYAEAATNYNWSIMTAALDPAVTNVPAPVPNPYNIDGAAGGTNETDYFLSFFVPFKDVVAGLASNGVTGVTANTAFRYVFITASQPNSINQDINGVNGSGDPPYTNIVNLPISPNQPPVVVDDFATTLENKPVTISVLINDYDPNFDALTITNATTTNGSVAIVGTNLLFTPVGGFIGTAFIAYTISDVGGLTASGTVTVTVSPRDPDLPGPGTNIVTIPAGSLVIPMDNTNQSIIAPFNLKAYGLVNRLLQNNIPIKWAIRAGKGKDEADFSANAFRIAPSVTTASNLFFAGGPFIIHKDYTNLARPIITAFSNNVAVYQLTADTDVDIRHEIAFHPNIAINTVNASIHTDLLDFAGITNYTAIADASLLYNSCFTIFMEPHNNNTNGVASVKNFVLNGGNFLAECLAVETYENAGAGHFQSTSNIVTDNIGNALVYPNPDLAYSQFIGIVDPAPGGSHQDWTLGGGSFINNGHIHLDNTNGGSVPPPHHAATSSKHASGRGGMVFYLGGHDYGAGGNDITTINGQRMILNALFIPSTRPSCGFDFVADLAVSKSAAASVVAGSNLTYAITVTNSGPATASNVVVSDVLPAGATFVSATGGGTNSGGTVTWPAIAALANGGSTNYTLIVSAPAGGILSNVASVTATTIDSTLTNNTTPPVITSVTPSADVKVVKTGSASVVAGQNLSYTIIVTNSGPSTASNVVASDVLPAGATFVSASDGGTNNAGTVMWPAITALANGDSISYTLTVSAPASGSLTNTATASSPTSDPNPTNNTSPPVTASVTPAADLQVFKSGATNVIAGQNLTYTITVTNNGPSAAASVVVSDPLPPGVSFVSASGGGSNNAGTVMWPAIASLANGGSANYTLTVNTLVKGPLTNVAGVTSPTGDPNPTNNTSPPVTTAVANRAPVANNQGVSTPEDMPAAITLTGSDADGDPFTFAIVDAPSNGVITGFNPTNGTLTYTPATNYSGGDSFTFRVNDGTTNSVLATVTLTITARNDAPVAFSQNLTNAEDTALSVLLTGFDVDGPATNFTVISIPTNGSLRVVDTNSVVLLVVTNNTSLGSTNGLSYLPNTNFVGADSFTFIVDDGALTSAVATVSLTLTNVNEAPTNFTLSNASVPENQPGGTTVGTFGGVADPDFSDTHTFSLVAGTGSTGNASFTIVSNTLQTAAIFDYEAQTNYSIRVRVTDAGGLFVEKIFTVTVTDVNEQPVLSIAIPDRTGTYGSPFSYTFPTNTFTDPDAGQTLSYVATNLPPGVTFNAATRTFNGTPTAAGTFTVSITATDTGVPGLSAGDSFDIVVGKAGLTLVANNLSRAYGETNPPLTYIVSGFVLGDTTNVLSGAPALSTTATPSSPAGTYPITITAGTLSAANYSFTFVNGNLTVGLTPPTVTWTPASPIVYGTPLTTNQLNATASVPGTFDYTPPAGTVRNVGTAPLTVVFAPTDTNNYSSVMASASLTVLPAALSVNADNLTRVFGQTNAPLTYTLTGFVNGDTTNVLHGGASLATPATTASSVGTYPINFIISTLSATNYIFNFVAGSLTVTVATPTITWAPNGPIVYGTPLTTNQLNATSPVPGIFDYTPPAGTVRNVGTAPLTVVFTPTDTTNYTNVSASAPLTVLPATLNAAADNLTRVFGATNPPLTYTLTGFVNGDTTNVLHGGASLSTAATPASSVGTYPINFIISTLSATNYVFSFSSGSLTVTAATPTITWVPDGPIVYGTPLTTNQLNATAPVPGTFIYTPPLGTVPNSGSNLLMVLFVPTDTNNYTTATLSVPLFVTPATLTLAAEDKTAVFGAAIPSLSYAVTGFVNSETTNVLSGAPSLSTAATPGSSIGTYPITITAGTLAAANYVFSLANGVLTITPATPPLTWSPDGPIIYGMPLTTNQLNATSPVPGTFFYAPPPGNVPNAGTNLLTVVFIPSDTNNYFTVTSTVPLTVLQAILTARADDKMVAAGAPIPPLTISYTGFASGEDASVLDVP
ncbi:MAG TPA: MBG domain-containing protein, partial [Verrucomicrobiae bacterium]